MWKNWHLIQNIESVSHHYLEEYSRYVYALCNPRRGVYFMPILLTPQIFYKPLNFSIKMSKNMSQKSFFGLENQWLGSDRNRIPQSRAWSAPITSLSRVLFIYKPHFWNHALKTHFLFTLWNNFLCCWSLLFMSSFLSKLVLR